MARGKSKKLQHSYNMEEEWLREYALFYGTNSVTRFSIQDLHGVSLTEVHEALANVSRIRCDKCDGPGTVCQIEAVVADAMPVRVTVQFNASEMTLSILEARQVRGNENDEPDHAA